jgi:hypothetical protein
VIPDIGYAGYFYHAVSGLNFALYRAYDPVHARWLNRDPIGALVLRLLEKWHLASHSGVPRGDSLRDDLFLRGDATAVL